MFISPHLKFITDRWCDFSLDFRLLKLYMYIYCWRNVLNIFWIWCNVAHQTLSDVGSLLAKESKSLSPKKESMQFSENYDEFYRSTELLNSAIIGEEKNNDENVGVSFNMNEDQKSITNEKCTGNNSTKQDVTCNNVYASTAPITSIINRNQQKHFCSHSLSRIARCSPYFSSSTKNVSGSNLLFTPESCETSSQLILYKSPLAKKGPIGNSMLYLPTNCEANTNGTNEKVPEKVQNYNGNSSNLRQQFSNGFSFQESNCIKNTNYKDVSQINKQTNSNQNSLNYTSIDNSKVNPLI